MDNIISTLQTFFEFPYTSFYIREIARRTKINHTTIRQRIIKLAKEGYLVHNTQTRPYDTYKSNTTSSKYHNLKLFYNLEKIRQSNLIPKLEQIYDYPTIVLFGSYAKAEDDEKSDIDLCIISPITKEFPVKLYSLHLKRPLSIHLFAPVQWNTLKKKNSELVNNICNGIVLSGQLEVV